MGTTLGSGSGLDQDKTLACRTLGTPPRHAWRTVPPTATTTLPARAARTPARSPQDQGRYPGRLPRPALYPTVYFPQCSTTAPPRFEEKTTTFTIPCACTPSLLVPIKGGGGLSLKGAGPFGRTQRSVQLTEHIRSSEPDIGTRLNQLPLWQRLGSFPPSLASLVPPTTGTPGAGQYSALAHPFAGRTAPRPEPE